MFILSSPLALKGRLRFNTTTTILLAIFVFTLYITSCEARRLRVNGNHSSNKASLLSKDATEGGDTTKKQIRALLMVHDTVLDQEIRAGSSINPSMAAEAKSIDRSGDSSCGSLRKRFERIEVRSDKRERSVLGVESNRAQVGSEATTTVYTAETLVAMDYPVAHPAPAVHNR